MMMGRNLGPRVFFKRDEESSIGRGAVMYGAHFRPEIALMIWAATRCAPFSAVEVHVTEGHRDIRVTRDLHEELRALDFTFRKKNGTPPSRGAYEDTARRMKDILDFDYDIEAHGEGSNLHIHSELDPT